MSSETTVNDRQPPQTTANGSPSGLPVLRPLSRVRKWEINPRGGECPNLEEMMQSLREKGLEDPIHVWERTDGDLILRGHRRFEGMMELGWTECLMVVHHFDSEEEAYKYLLLDHGTTVPLNPEEKITAVENGVKLGLTVAELAPALSLSVQTVQLYFDLGEILPANGRTALAEGKLSLANAELLKQVPQEEDRRAAVRQMIMNSVDGEPMNLKQAQNYIQATFVQPRKWQEGWLELSNHLKKKVHKVIDGYSYVAFDMADEYVQGPTGQPLPEYEFSHALMPKHAGVQWGEKAKELGVTIYVVSAPLHGDKYVLLVNKRMVRDASSAEAPKAEASSEDTETRRGGDAEREEVGGDSEGVAGGQSAVGGGQSAVGGAEELPTDHGLPSTDAPSTDALRVWLRVFLGAIWDHLVQNPTDVMTKGPWLRVQGLLTHLATDVDAGALEAWLGITEAAALTEWMGKDKVNRSSMRHVLMLLLCIESDSQESDPKGSILAVAQDLGLDVEALEVKAAAAGAE